MTHFTGRDNCKEKCFSRLFVCFIFGLCNLNCEVICSILTVWPRFGLLLLLCPEKKCFSIFFTLETFQTLRFYGFFPFFPFLGLIFPLTTALPHPPTLCLESASIAMWQLFRRFPQYLTRSFPFQDLCFYLLLSVFYWKILLLFCSSALAFRNWLSSMLFVSLFLLCSSRPRPLRDFWSKSQWHYINK